MKKYGFITKEFLQKEYIDNKKSCFQIAKFANCTSMTVYNKLVKYNIPRRKSWETLVGKNRPEHAKKLRGKKNSGVSKANKKRVGKQALNYIDGRFLKTYYCVESNCDNKISYSNWSYGNKRCQSCSNRVNMVGKIPWNKNKKLPQFSGRKSGRFGKKMKPHWGTYKGIRMRSSYEIAYAKYLDNQHINWQYESKTFDLGNTTYTPDFYLSEKDMYIEVKGYMTDYAENKINKFKKQYSNIKFEILKKKQLKNMGVLK